MERLIVSIFEDMSVPDINISKFAGYPIKFIIFQKRGIGSGALYFVQIDLPAMPENLPEVNSCVLELNQRSSLFLL